MPEYKTQINFAKGQLYDYNFDPDTDSLEFLQNRKVKIKGDEGLIYFFKSKKDDDDKWKMDYVGLQPLDSLELSTTYTIHKRGIFMSSKKTVNEVIEEQLEKIHLRGRRRASTSSLEYPKLSSLFKN
ncbi:MAG: hypothetical protein IH946_03155 [Bacteroidetes bacterium]|nr:hypothetical protein [Bacteroidota bacterium]